MCKDRLSIAKEQSQWNKLSKKIKDCGDESIERNFEMWDESMVTQKFKLHACLEICQRRHYHCTLESLL